MFMFGTDDIQRRFYDLPDGANHYPFRSPRFWHGMRLGDSLRLMARHGFRVHPLSWMMALTVLGAGPTNSILGLLQRACLSRRVARADICHPPVFVIGHWRSGTTYMHELLACDERLAAPSTFECFAPAHFLVSQPVLAPLTRWMLPARRPQDNVKLGWDQPQEDEFALCNLGVPSPYLQIAFPSDPPAVVEFLSLQNVSEGERQRWTRALENFYRALTYRHGKRLAIKSPTHTGRAWLLAQLFPGARFVHLVRDPQTMIPSTMRMWRSFYATQAFQRPRNERLDEYIFSCLETMYQGLEASRDFLDDGSLYDVRYEDFIVNPIQTLENVYQQLELGDFEVVRGRVESYVKRAREYHMNRHQVSEELRQRIARRSAEYGKRYGYG